MIAEVMTWVVEIGAWKRNAAVNMIDAPVVSAAKPCGGSSSMILRPSVRMMRQPPAYVPSDSITAQAILTQTGIGSPCVLDIGDDQGHHHDAHRLLRVLQTVPERHAGRRHRLRYTETALGLVRVGPAEDPQDRAPSPDSRASRPTIGEMNIGMTTFSSTPDQMTVGAARERRADHAAEQRVRGGRRQPEVPGDQVPDDRADQRGEQDAHPLARPAGVSISPSLTVLATPLPRKAPARFITAAIASAARGVSARVETEVAIAFAESWKPLVYVKQSATPMVTTSAKVSTRGQDSLTAMVSTVFATCSKASAASSSTSTICLSFSTSMASYLPLKRCASSLRWIWSAWFSRRLTSIQYSVRLSIVRRLRHGLGGQLGRPRQHLDLLLDALGQLLDLVEDDQVDGLLHEVHDVVERRGEVVDVLAVERRDEGGVQLVEDRVRGVVTRVLRGPHPLCDLGPGGGVRPEQFHQELRARDDVVRGCGEHVVEARLPGGQTKAHVGSSGCIGFGQADARRIIRPRLTGRPQCRPSGSSGRHGAPGARKVRYAYTHEGYMIPYHGHHGTCPATDADDDHRGRAAATTAGP